MIVPALCTAERVRLSCEARPEGSMYRSEWLQPWFVEVLTPCALKAALENHCHEDCRTGYAAHVENENGIFVPIENRMIPVGIKRR